MVRPNGARWQPQELARAIVLLCHFHSLAIFCLGTGVNLEIDHFVVDIFSEAKKSAPATPVAIPSTIFGDESHSKDAISDVSWCFVIVNARFSSAAFVDIALDLLLWVRFTAGADCDFFPAVSFE